MRGATPLALFSRFHRKISIHAPHAGRDMQKRAESEINKIIFQSTRPMRGATADIGPKIGIDGISIHAPHAGRDLEVQQQRLGEVQFQSTRPMRGATPYLGVGFIIKKFQSTRPMRGATAG